MPILSPVLLFLERLRGSPSLGCGLDTMFDPGSLRVYDSTVLYTVVVVLDPVVAYEYRNCLIGFRLYLNHSFFRMSEANEAERC